MQAAQGGDNNAQQNAINEKTETNIYGNPITSTQVNINTTQNKTTQNDTIQHNAIQCKAKQSIKIQ